MQRTIIFLNKQCLFDIKIEKKYFLCIKFGFKNLITCKNEKYFGNWSYRTDWFGTHYGIA